MMSVALVLVSVILVLLLGLMAKSWIRRSNLPGPPLIPFFGVAAFMWQIKTKDILPLFIGWYKKYGEIFEVEVFGMPYVFVAEPEVVEPVLTNSVNITKGYFEYKFFRPMFNDGLIVSDGDKWRSRRKLLTPSFHFKILELALISINRNAKVHVSDLLASGGKPMELEEAIFLSTLKLICETAMGVQLSTKNKKENQYIKASKICLDEIVERYLRVWRYPEFMFRFCSAGKLFFKNVEITHNFDKQVIRQRKELFQAEKNGSQNNGSEKNDRRKAFLDSLIELEDSHPGLFTESDMMEEVDTFMTAGHHTTASAMMFAYLLLANHPDIQEKVYDEQIAIFENDERMPTIQDLSKMVYLEMVIKETLRLYPTVPFTSRLLKEDLRIDENRVIKAGKTVVVFTYGVHHSKKHWDNPDEFIPERFTPGTNRHSFSYIPFSAGPRNCIGQKYAILVLKTMLSTVVRKCWLEPVASMDSLDLDYAITLKPSGGLLVKVLPRDNTKASLSQ
ncbi:unnamed protein product [Nezara viridula]|uniref:Cytochrome P450 n=1 Tax=Nezara viridula TaxID=85310 RepID=A0A9P0MPJ0_NEZVI|nr:unnamed protein product [Nezara viridula]